MSAAPQPPPRVAELTAFLDGLVQRGIVPGGVAAVAAGEGAPWIHAFGLRALVPEPEPATHDTLYDVASLTKPLVTAALWLHAREEGRADLDEPVTRWVPEMAPRSGEPRAPTIAELLLHAGGLPAWKPLYALVDGGLPERAAWLARHRGEPGRRAVYGCPGYQVLGLAVERALDAPLRELARRHVLRGGDDAVMGPVPAGDVGRTAPTEEGNAHERVMSEAEAEGHASFRTAVIRGAVHDHNAFTAGGAAGNAGLFATAAATAALCARWLRRDDALLAELGADLAPHADDGGESRTWGFQCARSRNSSAGESLSDRAFGHSGFTGTSAWIDPVRDAVYVLLTNRVHPRFVDHPFHAERRRFHDLAVAALDELHG